MTDDRPGERPERPTLSNLPPTLQSVLDVVMSTNTEVENLRRGVLDKGGAVDRLGERMLALEGALDITNQSLANVLASVASLQTASNLRAADEERSSGQHSAPPVPDTIPSAPPNRPTVLVIDDEPELRRMMVRILDSNEYTVISAYDGRTALELVSLAVGAPVIAIVDISMPGNGGKVIDHVREHHPEIELVLTSGYPEAEATATALGALFLPKPFYGEQLTAIVASAIERANYRKNPV